MGQRPAQHPYDPDWPAQAMAEATRWRAALGDVMTDCHHIGSTAVPGLSAKPVLDLIPVVCDLAALDERRPAIEALGYEWCGAFGLPGRRFCRLERDGKRIAHAHCYAVGSPEITRHLAFRDALRGDDLLRDAYGALKARCAAQHPDMAGYCACKDSWIKAQEARALHHYQGISA